MTIARDRLKSGAPWLCAICLAGCGDGTEPDLPGDIEWKSEHFVYHARSSDGDACPAVLDQMERHFDAIQAATGLPWPEGRVVHYYKFLDASDYAAASGCPEGTSGCASGGNAYAYEPFHEHELIHAYFEPLGRPPRILSEGVAELLACSPLDFFDAAREPALEAYEGVVEIELNNPGRDAPYRFGKLLVGHLIEAYGWEAFLELYRGPWDSRNDAELEQNLQELYGISFDAAWAEASHLAPGGPCVAAWACAAAALAPGVAETPTASCGDSPYRGVAGAFQLDTAGEDEVAFLLQCRADPGEPVYRADAVMGQGTFVDLGEDNHVAFTLGDVTLASRPLDSSGFGAECSELDAVELDPAEAGAQWLFRPPTSPYFLRLGLPRGTELTLVVEGVSGPVLVCPSCEASTECLSVENAATLAVSAGVVLHFPAGSADDELAQLRMALR